MEVDRLEGPDVPGDGQRILADEQVLERLEAVHRVARADPDDPLVGLDPDDRRRERRPRDGVPGGRERRVERDHEPRRGRCAVIRIAPEYRAVATAAVR